MKDTITRSEYYQLIGLLTLGQKYEKILEQIEMSMCEITGEGEELGSRSGDAIYQGETADELLKALNIKVDGPKKLHN